MGIAFGTMLPLLVVCLDCISHEAVGGAHGKYLLCFLFIQSGGNEKCFISCLQIFPIHDPLLFTFIEHKNVMLSLLQTEINYFARMSKLHRDLSIFFSQVHEHTHVSNRSEKGQSATTVCETLFAHW